MTAENLEGSLAGHFSTLEDPRDLSRLRHKLIDMVVVAIAAVICGADDWVGVAAFGRAKEAWFRQFLELPNGIPAHDTFGRVFSVLAPGAFAHGFRAWLAAIRQVLPGEIVAIDGKTLRRSHDRAAGLAPLHGVRAWATANRVVLGQIATEAKSNEITAIPRLLEWLLLKGSIVTIDAMGCQTKIAERIIAQGGDNVLALKGNQGTLAAHSLDAALNAGQLDITGSPSVTGEGLDLTDKLLGDLAKTARQLGGVSERTVRRLIDIGAIERVHIGRRLLVRADSVRAHLDRAMTGSDSRLRAGPDVRGQSTCRESARRWTRTVSTGGRIRLTGGPRTSTRTF